MVIKHASTSNNCDSTSQNGDVTRKNGDLSSKHQWCFSPAKHGVFHPAKWFAGCCWVKS
jgi:hypothetical protein